MDRWILAMAVATLFAVGGFWLLLMNVRRQTVPVDSGGQISLRHGTLFRAYACGLFLGLELLIGSLALFIPPTSALAIGLVVSAAVIAAGLGLVLLWDAYRFRITVSSRGMDCQSPWRGTRSISWSDVNRVSFSTANLWFAVEPKTGPPFHILAFVPGVQQFLASCEANLPVEKLVAAEPGYDWVWRKFPNIKDKPPRPRSRIRVWLLRAIGLLFALILLGLGLFCINGLVLAAREKPVIREIAIKIPAANAGRERHVVVVSHNVAKAFAHRGGMDFDHPANVTKKLDLLAQAIHIAQPDIVCLSEVLTEAGTMPIDQVEYLAKATGMPYVAFGENFNFGWPGYRIIGGNAILSRTPLTPVANIPLVGRKPFFVTTNNRRALFAETELHGQTVLVGSLHNDSLDEANNDAQMKQILEFVGDRPCILAGDFHAKPASPTLKRLEESKRFSGEIVGQPTYPAAAPERRVAYAFGPVEWTHLVTEAWITGASDHWLIVAAFTVPEK